MKFTMKREVEAKYLELSVPVNYEDEDMPFDAPMRIGDTWRATIDLDEGRILDWPAGKTLSMECMKVVDEGVYVLLDADRNEIARREDYVPNDLLPGNYGDYLSLEIDETGRITNWLDDASLADFEGDDE